MSEYVAHDPDYDYTAGDPVPVGDTYSQAEPEISADDIVLSGGEAFDKDVEAAEKTAASREFRDIPPGDHLLKVVGLSGIKIENKSGWINGQEIPYRTYTAFLRLCLPNETQATTGIFLTLPPAPGLYDSRDAYKAAMRAYCHGLTRADGKESGWHAGVFGNVVTKLCGNYDPAKPLPATHDPKNWKDKLVWATVDIEKPNKNAKPKVNPATGEPYPPREARPAVKAMTFRAYVPGKPDPAPRKAAHAPAPARPTKAQLAEKTRQSLQQPALAGVGAAPVNGSASIEEAGLDSV